MDKDELVKRYLVKGWNTSIADTGDYEGHLAVLDTVTGKHVCEWHWGNEDENDANAEAICAALNAAFNTPQPGAEPYGYVYQVNNTYTCFVTKKPPDDAYDEGTLVAVYTAPPSGQREGLLRAAEMLQKMADTLVHKNCVQDMETGVWEGGSDELNAKVEILDDMQDAIRAEAEKLPETPELYDSLAAAFKRHRATQEKLPQDSEWRSHDNSGMRYPESSDTSGGETDAKLPQSHVLVPVDDLREGTMWLRSALDCKDWQWDADQRECAEGCYQRLRAAQEERK